MLQTDGFDAQTAAMLREIYDEVCAQYVSLAADEQGMREAIAAAIEGIARNGQRKRERILRYARFKAAEMFSAP
jgi:hypothetical protein